MVKLKTIKTLKKNQEKKLKIKFKKIKFKNIIDLICLFDQVKKDLVCLLGL